MTQARADPIVHLELQTPNLPRACSFYTRLFGWRVERVETNGFAYRTLELGRAIAGGIVENDAELARWLPYVQVVDITEATAHARLLGGSVLLEPREGPVGWRSIVAAPLGAEIALWQPKR